MRSLIRDSRLVRRITVSDEIEIPENATIEERYALGEEQDARIRGELGRLMFDLANYKSFVPRKNVNVKELSLLVIDDEELEEELNR